MNLATQLPKFEGLRGERVAASPQFDREAGRFRNRASLAEPRPSMGTILEFFRGSDDREPTTPLPVVDPRPGWSRPCGGGVRTTWLGHSSVLLELETAKGKRLRVLTDPVFGERAPLPAHVDSTRSPSSRPRSRSMSCSSPTIITITCAPRRSQALPREKFQLLLRSASAHGLRRLECDRGRFSNLIGTKVCLYLGVKFVFGRSLASTFPVEASAIATRPCGPRSL